MYANQNFCILCSSSLLCLGSFSKKPHSHSFLCDQMHANLNQAPSINRPFFLVHSTSDQEVMVEDEVEDFNKATANVCNIGSENLHTDN
ncbi:unnamed protein product [Citrullus colocynthis]|uniref:Uncharacterized protein n=1 Tax=Citrullus colocynthis TaxID=252529 RepID=A0ABP0Y5T0_9ROSI